MFASVFSGFKLFLGDIGRYVLSLCTVKRKINFSSSNTPQGNQLKLVLKQLYTIPKWMKLIFF